MDPKKWAFEINLNNLEFNTYRYIKNLEINTVWEPMSHKVGKCKFLEKLPKKLDSTKESDDLFEIVSNNMDIVKRIIY